MPCKIRCAVDQDRSPIEAEREWQHQAEINVLDRLQRVGLLSPPGDIDKVLETVVNNLEVTNNLDIQPEVHCRVLLTSTLEMFSIGHTIVLSRGLLDVLPDEASLATMLAQELADIIVTKPSTDQWGFNDMTNVSTVEALSHFSFKDSPEQVKAAGAKSRRTSQEFSLQGQARQRWPIPEATGRPREGSAGLDQPPHGQPRVYLRPVAGRGARTRS